VNQRVPRLLVAVPGPGYQAGDHRGSTHLVRIVSRRCAGGRGCHSGHDLVLLIRRGPRGPVGSARAARRFSWLRAPAGGPDVLVDVERVVRVVAVLDLGEPVIVGAVGRFDPVLALVHHEVDVGAAGRGRVQLLPVVLGPLRDEARVGQVRVDAHDDAGPAAVPVGEGCRAGGHAAGGAVDGVHV